MSNETDGGDSSMMESQRFEYNLNDNETLVQAVLNAVSAVTNTPLLPSESPASAEGNGESLPPLYDAVDPDALTSLSTNETDEGAGWQVTFPYAGCNVTVTSTDTILVNAQPSVESSGD